VNMNPEKGKEAALYYVFGLIEYGAAFQVCNEESREELRGCSTTFSVLKNTERASRVCNEESREERRSCCSTTFSGLMNTEPLPKVTIKLNQRKKGGITQSLLFSGIY